MIITVTEAYTSMGPILATNISVQSIFINRSPVNGPLDHDQQSGHLAIEVQVF